MELICPDCHNPLSPEDVNAATNVALCRSCGHAFRLDDLVGSSPAVTAAETRDDPTVAPPRGCWYRDAADGWTAGATTRSPIAFFLIPFMVVWSGFSLGGIYGTQIISGKFNWASSLFGIPFFLGTLLFGSIALMAVFGKVEVRAQEDQCVVFTGMGSWGWRKRFKIGADSRVGLGFSAYRNSGFGGAGYASINVTGPTDLQFGTGLNYARKMFLVKVLRHKFNLPEDAL